MVNIILTLKLILPSLFDVLVLFLFIMSRNSRKFNLSLPVKKTFDQLCKFFEKLFMQLKGVPQQSFTRGGTYKTFLELAKFYKWISLSLQIRIMGVKIFFEYFAFLTLHRGSEILKIPIIGSKLKIVADLWCDLSKLVREGH